MTTKSTLYADSRMQLVINPSQRPTCSICSDRTEKKNNATRHQTSRKRYVFQSAATIPIRDDGQQHENKYRRAIYERLHKPTCGHKARFVLESDVSSILPSIVFLFVYV